MAELLLAMGKIMASYRLEDYDFVSLSKHAKKRRVHERLLILAHVKMGKSITQAADALFVGKPVVKRCLKNVFAKGLEGLEAEQKRFHLSLGGDAQESSEKKKVTKCYIRSKRGNMRRFFGVFHMMHIIFHTRIIFKFI